MKYFKLFENWNGDNLLEASLSGPNRSDNFNPKVLQTFHRYVELNDKHDPQSRELPTVDFSTENKAELYKIGLEDNKAIQAGVQLPKNTDGITIIVKNTTDLVQVPVFKKNGDLSSSSPKYYVPIKYKGKEYLISLKDLRKPTGKAVEEWNPDLSKSKTQQGVVRPFTAGHPQEQQICEMFVANTNKDWQFKFNEYIYEVTLVGGANYRGKGHPKTDIELRLSCITDPTHILKNKSKIQNEVKNGQYKVSLKDKSANFVEGWLGPKRAHDIFGDDLGEQVQKIWNSIKNADPKTLKGFKKRGITGNTIILFIGVKNSGYFNWEGKKHSSGVDTWKLSPTSLMEAYAGETKFGDMGQPDAIANCFYKGSTPKTPGEFLEELIPVNKSTVKRYMEPLYIQPQGRNNPSAKSSILFRKDKKGVWTINNEWLAQAGLAGKIK